jgi:hypothetical protein
VTYPPGHDRDNGAGVLVVNSVETGVTVWGFAGDVADVVTG